MSAYVCSKTQFDLLVRAAKHYGGRDGFRWWRVDGDGDYVGWSKIERSAASYAGSRDDDHMHYVTESQAGQLLVSQNVASVSYRYGDCDADANLPGPIDAFYMAPYIYTDPGYVLNPAEVFKAIDCLDYQSCEHPEWRTSEAYAFLRSLRQDACRAVDGYADAVRDWEASDLANRRYSNPAPFRGRDDR